MRAGYFPELGVAEFRSDMPEPQIRYDKDVKIRIRKCGICGSEVHALHGMHPFRIPPVLSGHEFAGDVVEVGKGVTKFKPGDRVTGEPSTAAASATTASTECTICVPQRECLARLTKSPSWITASGRDPWANTSSCPKKPSSSLPTM